MVVERLLVLRMTMLLRGANLGDICCFVLYWEFSLLFLFSVLIVFVMIGVISIGLGCSEYEGSSDGKDESSEPQVCNNALMLMLIVNIHKSIVIVPKLAQTHYLNNDFCWSSS